MNTPIEDMELELKEQEIRQEQQQIQDSLTQMTESYRRAAETRSQELIKSYRTTLRVLLLVIALLVIAVIVVAVGWNLEQGTLVPSPVEVIKEIEVSQVHRNRPHERVFPRAFGGQLPFVRFKLRPDMDACA